MHSCSNMSMKPSYYSQSSTSTPPHSAALFSPQPKPLILEHRSAVSNHIMQPAIPPYNPINSRSTTLPYQPATTTTPVNGGGGGAASTTIAKLNQQQLSTMFYKPSSTSLHIVPGGQSSSQQTEFSSGVAADLIQQYLNSSKAVAHHTVSVEDHASITQLAGFNSQMISLEKQTAQTDYASAAANTTSFSNSIQRQTLNPSPRALAATTQTIKPTTYTTTTTSPFTELASSAYLRTLNASFSISKDTTISSRFVESSSHQLPPFQAGTIVKSGNILQRGGKDYYVPINTLVLPAIADLQSDEYLARQKNQAYQTKLQGENQAKKIIFTEDVYAENIKQKQRVNDCSMQAHHSFTLRRDFQAEKPERVEHSPIPSSGVATSKFIDGPSQYTLRKLLGQPTTGVKRAAEINENNFNVQQKAEVTTTPAAISTAPAAVSTAPAAVSTAPAAASIIPAATTSTIPAPQPKNYSQNTAFAFIPVLKLPTTFTSGECQPISPPTTALWKNGNRMIQQSDQTSDSTIASQQLSHHDTPAVTTPRELESVIQQVPVIEVQSNNVGQRVFLHLSDKKRLLATTSGEPAADTSSQQQDVFSLYSKVVSKSEMKQRTNEKPGQQQLCTPSDLSAPSIPTQSPFKAFRSISTNTCQVSLTSKSKQQEQHFTPTQLINLTSIVGVSPPTKGRLNNSEENKPNNAKGTLTVIRNQLGNQGQPKQLTSNNYFTPTKNVVASGKKDTHPVGSCLSSIRKDDTTSTVETSSFKLPCALSANSSNNSHLKEAQLLSRAPIAASLVLKTPSVNHYYQSPPLTQTTLSKNPMQRDIIRMRSAQSAITPPSTKIIHLQENGNYKQKIWEDILRKRQVKQSSSSSSNDNCFYSPQKEEKHVNWTQSVKAFSHQSENQSSSSSSNKQLSDVKILAPLQLFTETGKYAQATTIPQNNVPGGIQSLSRTIRSTSHVTPLQRPSTNPRETQRLRINLDYLVYQDEYRIRSENNLTNREDGEDNTFNDPALKEKFDKHHATDMINGRQTKGCMAPAETDASQRIGSGPNSPSFSHSNQDAFTFQQQQKQPTNLNQTRPETDRKQRIVSTDNYNTLPLALRMSFGGGDSPTNKDIFI